MELLGRQCGMFTIGILIIIVHAIIPSTFAMNASVSIDYYKQGGCNASILVRVGDFCDYVVTITIAAAGSNASTDLGVEIIMPENNTIVMQMSKPQITYVGGNFLNSQNLYNPAITMTSQQSSSQFDNARINFGTVVNSGLVSPGNNTQSMISLTFRSIVISNPGYQINGSQYWVTVGIEYNNVSEIWIGQALFIFSNLTSGGTGLFTLDPINNSSLQTNQGSPFALYIPIVYNATYASNFVFTITNDNPLQLGLCSAYVQSATTGFQHLPSLGYEISQTLTSALISNQISITLGQIVNSQSYSGSPSTLTIVVYGRVFKTDGLSSYIAGSMTARVTSASPLVSRAYTVYALPSVTPGPVNGTLPSFSVSQQSTTVGIHQTLSLSVTMTVPMGFTAPVVFELSGSSNTSTPVLKACSVVFQSAGENVGSSNPQCTDTNLARRTYTSSINSSDYDQLVYDYGVISNTGSRSTTYASNVNTLVFNAVFQLLNTTQTTVWPALSMAIGNNTIWLANAAANVVSISYNTSNATRPSFALSYADNSTTNQSVTDLGYTRLVYYDIYTQPNGIYTPMTLRITTNETFPGSQLPAATICLVKVLYVGTNIPCLISDLYNQAQSSLITYSSRYNQRKNDTAYVYLGALCNYQTTQTDPDFGRVRLGVYVKVEPGLGDGKTTYLNLDVYYAPSNLWIGQILFTGRQPAVPPTVGGTPLLFPLNTTTQSFNINALTVVNYGLKIPTTSFGSYTALTSAISNEANQQTSVCRVDISPNRGINVPCSNDVSSIFTYNPNGISSQSTTDLGMICSVAANSSSINATLSIDSDTLIVQVFLLATTQTSSSFDLTLSNLLPSGQTALASVTSSFTGGLVRPFGNPSSINPLNATAYQQTNDTSNGTLAYLGQDVLIRTQLILAPNLTNQSCYSLIFYFNISAATINSAYFTNGLFVSAGDNLMCMKSKATPVLSSGGSTLYNAAMYLDFGTFCYYPIDPTNVTASTLIVQGNVRIPVTTTVPVNSQIAVNTIAMINQNQTSLSTNTLLTVQNYTSYSGFTSFSNDTTGSIVSTANSTIQSGIRQSVNFEYKIYLPTYSQGRLQITIASVQNASSVTVNIISATILSAGINVGSFMSEYAWENKYQWTYSSSVVGSTYQDTAYLDLGVVTNTGTSVMLNTFSNTTDNFIVVQATGYLTDSPSAEENNAFQVALRASFGGINVSAVYANVVARNGTERPIILVNRTDITSGSYGVGSTYSGTIQFSHANNSNAECINAQLIIYLPTWILLQSYNSTITGTNYTTDNTSYIRFDFGTLLFNDAGSLTFTLNIGTSNEMALVYQRYNSPSITIPYEFLCMKRARTNVIYYPASKVFAFPDVISLGTSMTPVSNYPSLLDSLATCQFTSSVRNSDASLVRTTGWQTGYRSNQWMLSGSTYVQLNFGNLTLITGIQLTVPLAFAPIRTIQLGYSWDGISFVLDPTGYNVNGSSFYTIPLPQSMMVRYLRVYLIDVAQPNDLLTKTSGFTLNVTGAINSSNVVVADVCPLISSVLTPRTILVAPPSQTGLTYAGDVYVCDETTMRTMIQCHVLRNGDTSASATWTALNTTVANIILFVYDPDQQMQFLYGYAQDGRSIVRSDDRGLTWSVTDQAEYSNITAQCGASTKVCRNSESYSLMSGAPGSLQLQSGSIPWTAKIDGLWTLVSGGVISFDWF